MGAAKHSHQPRRSSGRTLTPRARPKADVIFGPRCPNVTLAKAMTHAADLPVRAPVVMPKKYGVQAANRLAREYWAAGAPRPKWTGSSERLTCAR